MNDRTCPSRPCTCAAGHKPPPASRWQGENTAAGQPEAGRALLSEALRLDPSLAQGENPPLLSILISWAAEPVTGDPAAFTRALMEHLPDGMDWEQRFGGHFMRSACISRLAGRFVDEAPRPGN